MSLYYTQGTVSGCTVRGKKNRHRKYYSMAVLKEEFICNRFPIPIYTIGDCALIITRQMAEFAAIYMDGFSPVLMTSCKVDEVYARSHPGMPTRPDCTIRDTEPASHQGGLNGFIR